MYKVIIADDKALIRAGLFYRNNWKEMGYEVTALLEDGADVLEFLERERADVLLADICMYSVSGLEAAKVIQGKYPWMKVVLISGYQDFEFAKEAISYRVYDYLLKPIDYDKLKEVFLGIKEELDQSKRVELMRKWYHEDEYDSVLYLLQCLPQSEDDNQKTWKDYTDLWGIFQKSSAGFSEHIAVEMLELLEKEVRKRNLELAEEFDKKILALDEQEDTTLLEHIRWLEVQLKEQGLLEEKAKKDEEILRACTYIRDHLEEAISLEKVADYVHLSTRQFTRRFNQQMGENFKEYMYRMRMEKAVSLWERGDTSLEDICEKVGYKDYKYFYQLFKKYTGNGVHKR